MIYITIYIEVVKAQNKAILTVHKLLMFIN
ncbi:hypothetical protein APLC1_2149 [Limnospira platensis C1]|nr:hypothetical protein APLC1_2149 [Arthrospira platensis C1]